MNKQRVDSFIPVAYQAIAHKQSGIANKNNEVDKGFRGQISAFCAALQMGSIRAAVAFYSKKGGALTDRHKLGYAIYLVLSSKDGVLPQNLPEEDRRGLVLYDMITGDNPPSEEELLDAAVSIKLALNLYDLIETNKEQAADKEQAAGEEQ